MTKSKSKHTPTPWYAITVEEPYQFVDEEVGGRVSYDRHLHSKDGEVIPGIACGKTPKQADANAMFILRAVNAHEELVRACKSARQAMNMVTNDGDLTGLCDAIEAIVSAILKAEKGE